MKIHFVGIGGIGMSGLAAMCYHLGYEVTGSDRGADKSENQRILGALRNQGIVIYPQDGSFVKDGLPEKIVYSTAIENDNPDFLAAPNVERVHRAAFLEQMIKETKVANSIAVTGSCGKSTVSSYLAEALLSLGEKPYCITGALANNFATPSLAGNFYPGDGKFLVFEADESDKSLLSYSPDYALILNIGCDHYDKEELARVFGSFLQQVKKGAVLSSDVYNQVKDFIPKSLPVAVFGEEDNLAYKLVSYQLPKATFNVGSVTLPQSGKHTALNALAIYAMLEMLGFEKAASLKAIEHFGGIWRRNDYAGKTASGALVYDDYAHNPEKIISCLSSMKELITGRVIAIFQPHGYGPWGFMEEELGKVLDEFLSKDDVFIVMEPYYAGGTSSFKPSAKEVVEKWQQLYKNKERFRLGTSRDEVASFVKENATSNDIVVVMGARDNSLSTYAKSLTNN